MSIDVVVPHSLDDYFKSTPIGSLDRAIGDNLYGINHRQTRAAVPSNKDVYGLTFFVRPQLNMQIDNIRNLRLFSPLCSDSNIYTLQNFVRCSLDPRLQAGYKFGIQNPVNVAPINCPLVDNQNPFFPVLTNNLNSISGWPDTVAPTFTSRPGLYNEAWSMVDGVVKNYESFDITASFRNTRGDPIVYMFYVWLHYMANVFEGKLVPYLDMITENEIDYNTRIYRLVLDHTKTYVTKIAATGAAFPISIPMGSFFDYKADRPFNDQNKDISVVFRCMGAQYQDDILVKEFNDTVQIFNAGMLDDNRENSMHRVDPSLLHIFNNRGIPRINPQTYELEWWVDRDLFNRRSGAFILSGLANMNTATLTSNEENIGD